MGNNNTRLVIPPELKSRPEALALYVAQNVAELMLATVQKMSSEWQRERLYYHLEVIKLRGEDRKAEAQVIDDSRRTFDHFVEAVDKIMEALLRQRDAIVADTSADTPKGE